MNTIWPVVIVLAVGLVATIVTVVVSILVLFLSKRYARSGRKARYVRAYDSDSHASGKTTFEGCLTSPGIHPDTRVVFGPNAFACDRAKGKLVVQSLKTPECALLRCRDVSGYTLLCDGREAAERSRAGGEGMSMPWLSSDCETVELRIETTHKDYPLLTLTLMPFKFDKPELRAAAVNAAREITAVLDAVLDERV